MIPYGRHSVDEEDIDSVVDVLRHKFLTQGEMVPEFERQLAKYAKAQYCTAVNSGTSALHIACLALDCGSDDLVWTVPNSFVASANCARYCGAEVDFVDIDSKTRNISLEALEEKLIHAEKRRCLPKILIVVHFSGLSCEMHSISELCRKYNVKIIEDAAHAFGGTYLSEPMGSCRFSELTVFSFHPVKSITTAEGGAVTSNDAELQKRLQSFAKHGITRNNDEFKSLPLEPWIYEQQALGFNYRLSDLHAALGISQLGKVNQFVASRRHKAKRYEELLSGLPLKLPIQSLESAWHLYVIELEQHDRGDVFARLRAAGIGVNVHYIPIHLQPYYLDLGFKLGSFPKSEHYYNMALSLPIFPSMSEDQQNHVVKTLREILV